MEWTVDSNGVLTRFALSDGETPPADGVLTFPEDRNIYAIGTNVFAGDQIEWLRKLVLNSRCNTIKAQACKGNENIEEVVFGEGLEIIEEAAFAECYGLRAIVAQEGLEEIGAYAFCDCIGLETITITKRVCRMGEGAFFGCTNVHTIYIDGERKGSSTLDGSHEEADNQSEEVAIALLQECFANNSRLEIVSIPQRVVEISDSVGRIAFHNDYGIQQCFIPEQGWEPNQGGQLPIAEQYPIIGEDPITVSFIVDEPPPVHTKDVYPGTPYGTLPASPQKKGYIFQGWFLEKEGEEAEQILPTTICRESEDVEIKAKWEKVVYTVVFYKYKSESIKELEVYKVVSVPYQEKVDEPDEAPQRTGFKFLGWHDMADVDNPRSIVNKWPVTVVGDMNFVPLYEAGEDTSLFRVALDKTTWTATILGIDKGYQAAEIPEEIGIPYLLQVKGYGTPFVVAGIAAGAFSPEYDERLNDANITSITFTGTSSESGDAKFINIGVSAFKKLKTLASVTIPSTCETIGSFAFAECTNLTKINSDTNGQYKYNLPSSLQTIGVGAFQSCGPGPKPGEAEDAYSLSATVPGDNTTLSNQTFQGSKITELILNDSLKSIPPLMCEGCVHLSSVSTIPAEGDTITADKLPEGIEEIGHSAFKGCTELWLLTLPCGNLLSIGNFAFDGDVNLQVTLKGNAKQTLEIGGSAFRETNVHELNFGTTTEIGDVGARAFWDCGFLSNFSAVPSRIGYGSFFRAGNNLQDDESTPENEREFKIRDLSRLRTGSSLSPYWLMDIGQHAFTGSTLVFDTSAQVPSRLRDINFKNGWAISVKPNRLDSENELDFSSQGEQDAYKVIGVASGTFTYGNAPVLDTVTLPDTYCRICKGAFNYSNRPQSESPAPAFHVYIPLKEPEQGQEIPVEDKISFAEDAFVGIPNLIFHVNSLTNWTKGCLFEGRVSDGLYRIQIEGETQEVWYLTMDVPDNFAGGSDAQKIVVCKGCNRIGERAFQNCTSLETVEFAEDYDEYLEIGASAFSGCLALSAVFDISAESAEKYIGIDRRIAAIGRDAFNGCTNIATLFDSWDYSKDFNIGFPPRIDYAAFTDTGLTPAEVQYLGPSLEYMQKIGETISRLVTKVITLDKTFTEDQYSLSNRGIANALYILTDRLPGKDVYERFFTGSVFSQNTETTILAESDPELAEVQLNYDITEFFNRPDNIGRVALRLFSVWIDWNRVLLENWRETPPSATSTSEDATSGAATETNVTPRMWLFIDNYRKDRDGMREFHVSPTLEDQRKYYEDSENYPLKENPDTWDFGVDGSQNRNILGVVVRDLEEWCKIDFGEYSNPLRHGNYLYSGYIGETEEVDGGATRPKDPVLVEELRIGFPSQGDADNEEEEPYHLSRILPRAFDGCGSITSISIGDLIESIGRDAFRGLQSEVYQPYPPQSQEAQANGEESQTGEPRQGSDATNTEGATPELLLVDGWVVGIAPEYEGNYRFDLTKEDDEGQPIIKGIVDYAFADCPQLVTITKFPEGMKYTYESTINTEGLLDEETVPGCKLWGTEVVGYSTPAVANITIPGDGKVTSIRAGAFKDNTVLQSISIGFGEGTAEIAIGDEAFAGCSRLVTVHMSNKVTSIYRDEETGTCTVFKDCNAITSVTLPQTAISVGDYASSAIFPSYDSITTVVIAEGVQTLGNEAFGYWSSMKNVTIPPSVTRCGDMAFVGCSSLERVNISDINAWCRISFDESWSNPTVYAHNLYLNGALITQLSLPSNLTEIGTCQFEGCDKITSVTIPSSVESIGSAAFSNCKSLPAISIPNGVKRIGQYAFWNCIGLTSMTIPDSVTHIGKEILGMCDNIRSLTIPFIGPTIDSYDDSTVDPSQLRISYVLKSHDSRGRRIYAIAKDGSWIYDYLPWPLREVRITKAKGIGYAAFSGCNFLDSITIGADLEEIKENAFKPGYYIYIDPKTKALIFEGESAPTVATGGVSNALISNIYVPDTTYTRENGWGGVTPSDLDPYSGATWQGCPIYYNSTQSQSQT